MFAIFASSGTVRCSYFTHAEIIGGLVLSDDGSTVFVGTDSNGIFALEADDCSKRWKFPNLEATRFAYNVRPSVYNDFVIAAEEEGRIYVINAKVGDEQEGRVVGVYPARSSEPKGRFEQPGAVYKDRFYIGNYDGTVYALDIENALRLPPGLRHDRMPYAVERDDSDSERDPEEVRSAIVNFGDYLYFSNESNEVVQLEVGSRSPKIEWVYRTKGSVRGEIVATEDVVVFADRTGAIYAVSPHREDATKGEEDDFYEPELLWRDYTDDNQRIVGGPIVRDGVLYMIDLRGILYIMDLNDGDLYYKMELWGEPCHRCTSRPALMGDMLFVGTDHGTVLGIQLPIDLQP